VEPEVTPWLASLDLPVLDGTMSPRTAEELRELAGELGMALAFGGAGE
jgi:hypothetical protein